MNSAGDPAIGHSPENPVAVRHADDQSVIYLTPGRRIRGQEEYRNSGEPLLVSPRMGPPRFVRSIQPSQFDPERGALDAVHPGIPTHDGVMIFLFLPVIAQHLYFFLEILVPGDDCAGLPECSQILAGIEAEAARDPHRARLAALVLRPMRLTRVLDHMQPVASRDLKDRIHVGRLSKQMDWDNGLGSRTNGAFQ